MVALALSSKSACRVGGSLPPRDKPHEIDEVIGAIDGVDAAIEIVDDRSCDYTTLDVPSLIADNAWNAGLVVGDFMPTVAGPDLASCKGLVYRDEGPIDSGLGSDVLGRPALTLLWLANHLSAQGSGLGAGDIIMTGSFVETQFPVASHRFDFEIEGIGKVQLKVRLDPADP